jgi:hypothetical protein
LTLLVSLLAALSAIALPGAANAAPRQDDGLTINAVPQQIIAGEGVTLYGRLTGPDAGHRAVRLFHRVGSNRGFTLVGVTTTDANGYYEFTRAEGVVLTNRSWFVRGPAQAHSRTVNERVSALVSLAAPATQVQTSHWAVFTGNVAPGHAFERVVLEQRRAGTDQWQTLTTRFTGRGSHYRIAYRWRVPGVYELRVTFPGDRRNVRTSSDPITETVQQTQMPAFTINSSAPVINLGGATTISGVLITPGSTAVDGNVPITLLGRPTGQRSFTALAAATTGPDGSYRFTQAPTTNMTYLVEATQTPGRRSAALFEGVHSVISATTDSMSGATGSTLTFTGSVIPGSTGGIVYLQRLGDDGDWHNVAVTVTNPASGYSVATTLGDPGSETFRARVLGNGVNLGGASAPMTVTVSAASSPAALPPAS